MTEEDPREAMARFGRSLFARGYSCGTSGNLSVRLAGGGYLMSPTNISLGQLDPGQLSTLDSNGAHVAGPPPTKEAWLHLAMYKARPAGRRRRAPAFDLCDGVVLSRPIAPMTMCCLR